MLTKKITHKTEMYDHIIEGVEEVASIVARTLGPGGLPILIERTGQAANGDPFAPMITKDGVSVARECASDDANVDLVIQAIKDICIKTNSIAGDGTTTAIVLGRAILTAMLDEVKTNNLNPQTVRQSVEIAARKVIAALSTEVVECKSYDMIEHVATISANGDPEIGGIVRRAFEAVGTDGVITVDESGSQNHSLEVVDGFQFKRGAELQDRFFNNQDQTKFIAEDCVVLMYDGTLNSPAILIGVLDKIYTKYNGKMPPVLIMASEFSNEVLQVILMNRAEAGLSMCAIKNPHQTKVTTAMLDDMAVFLGGTRLGNGARNLNNFETDDLGLVRKVVIDKYSTTFYDGQGSEELVLARIEQLKAQKKEAESPYDASLLSDRIAALAEGIAKIGVGGLTDFEVKEKYHRIEDAINAARAAISEGVIPGGGATLLRIALTLGDATVGDRILSLALIAPFYQILTNLGIGETEILRLSNEVSSATGKSYDGISGEIVSAIESGIIDPVKVTKTALANAISIAALLSTCGGSITYKRKAT